MIAEIPLDDPKALLDETFLTPYAPNRHLEGLPAKGASLIVSEAPRKDGHRRAAVIIAAPGRAPGQLRATSWQVEAYQWIAERGAEAFALDAVPAGAASQEDVLELVRTLETTGYLELRRR